MLADLERVARALRKRVEYTMEDRGGLVVVEWELSRLDRKDLLMSVVMDVSDLESVLQYLANRGLSAIQIPQMTLPQQSSLRSRAFGFSLFSSYCSNTFLSSVAHVQQLSSMVVKACWREPRESYEKDDP